MNPYTPSFRGHFSESPSTDANTFYLDNTDKCKFIPGIDAKSELSKNGCLITIDICI